MERRVLLGAFASSAIFAGELIGQSAIGSIHHANFNEQACARFSRAQEFMSGLGHHMTGRPEDFLYHAGIVIQLGLTAYLFGRGVSDEWCRDRIGLDVEKALGFANHLGFGCDRSQMGALARLIGDYGQWRRPFTPPLLVTNLVQPWKVSAELGRLLELVRVQGRLF